MDAYTRESMQEALIGAIFKGYLFLRFYSSCQLSRNGWDSPGMLGLVPVASRLGKNTSDFTNLHLSWSSIGSFCRLHGHCSLIPVKLALCDTDNTIETQTGLRYSILLSTSKTQLIMGGVAPTHVDIKIILHEYHEYKPLSRI